MALLKKWKPVFAAVVAIGCCVGLYVYMNFASLAPVLARYANYVRAYAQPVGTLVIEQAPGTLPAIRHVAIAPVRGDGWGSYNRTLKSERFSPLASINNGNVAAMKVQCTYDTGQYTGFETGPIVIGDVMIATTAHDIFAIDAGNCRQIWRAHEEYKTRSFFEVNRGAAYLEGRLFRGTQDGRVLAYDFKTGKRLWATTIADGYKREAVPAALVAWQGLVFAGVAGGDIKGVKGRMYALDAATGKIVWEFYTVPRQAGDKVRGPLGKSPLDLSTWQNAKGVPISGGGIWASYSIDPATGRLYIPVNNASPDFAMDLRKGDNLFTGTVLVLDAKTGEYVHHYQLIKADWHDWGASGAPILVQTQSGRPLLAVTPKNGKLYGFDYKTNEKLYDPPINRSVNRETPFEYGKPVRICPGTSGGAEWNGPSYSPANNLLYSGQVDWCTTVQLDSAETIKNAPHWSFWFGHASNDPYQVAGKYDSRKNWGGWLYAVDADTGRWRWRARTNYPVLSGSTPTAGGLVFFGDMGGNFYALDADTGKKLWGKKIDGGIGGGVITYTARGVQKVAVAAGFTSPLWPSEQATGKIIILGLK